MRNEKCTREGVIMYRYMWDGSYTVEAAFIVPVVLGILYGWMFQLFYLHDQVVIDGMLQEMVVLRQEKKECGEQEIDRWREKLQEDAVAQLTATFAAGKDASIVMDEATVDSVEIVKLSSTTAEEGSSIAINSLTLNGDYTIPYAVKEGNVIKVALAQLDSVTQEAYKSRASVERELKVAVKASAVTSSGEGIQLSGNEVSITLKPGATPVPDPDGYYIVGDFKGWSAAGAIPMTKAGDNL